MVESYQVGQVVEDFEIDIYDPTDHAFDTFRLAENREQDRWTLLFFYPADFTFV